MDDQRQFSFDQAKAFLFDLDGTLIESDDKLSATFAERLLPLKRIFPRLDNEALGRRMVMAGETPSNYLMSVMEHLGLQGGFFGLADRLRRSRGIATRDTSEMVKGSLELLEALRQRYLLAVVTTRARPEALAFLEQNELERFFPVVITRQDVLRMKPHPEPVLNAAGMLNVAPEACVMVGDTMADIRAARRAGAFAVAVLSGFGERRELERAGAHLVLNHAVDLLEHPSWNGDSASS